MEYPRRQSGSRARGGSGRLRKAGQHLSSSAYRWEIAFVVLTGAGNFLLADWLDLQWVLVGAASLCWLGYVAVRASADRSVLAQWGITRQGFGRSMALLAPVLLLSVAGFAVYGALTGRMALHWHMLVVFLLYPLWGLVQQFLVVSLVAGNLERHTRLPRVGVVLLTAAVFAVAHAVYPALVAAAFFLALVTTTVFFRAHTAHACTSSSWAGIP